MKTVHAISICSYSKLKKVVTLKLYQKYAFA